MTDRNLSTTRQQVFGDVEPGTECRICGRRVDDGRRKVCSDYCDNIQTAVMGLLNWSSIRRRIIDRDDESCLACGWDRGIRRRAREHIRGLIDEAAGQKPESPGAREIGAGEDVDWQQWRQRRRDPARREWVRRRPARWREWD